MKLIYIFLGLFCVYGNLPAVNLSVPYQQNDSIINRNDTSVHQNIPIVKKRIKPVHKNDTTGNKKIVSYHKKDTIAKKKIAPVYNNDTVTLLKDTAGWVSDSAYTQMHSLPHAPNILDTLSGIQLLRKIFFLNENIKGIRVAIEEEKLARDFPRLKAIKMRPVKSQNWKFFVLILLIFYIGIIRLVNIKRFDEVLGSAFDLTSVVKNFNEKGSNYLLTSISLFIAFLVSISLFLVSVIEKTKSYETDNYFKLFFWIILGLILIYILKVFLNLMISGIFKMRGMAILTLLNAVFINNFLGIVLVFLTLIYIYGPDSNSLVTITGISFLTILAAIIYRLIKNILMAPKVSGYPIIYLFLYLCAFEIFPWLIVFKLFLNSW
ncbi:MAG: DUF4271 domain-containing protein [Bacteroidota bacterium]|nr:DUF4271 domain-containing protein [Bacteroidota bacterium]